MSDWAQIKEDFYKHLEKQAKKENSKIDEKELEKVSENKAVVKYQDEFNKWIKTQKDIDEKDLQKNSINLDDEDNENFFDEMFDDYISDLDKDDKVFDAIDTNSDGEISSNEKKIFLSSIKGLDEDEGNVTFSDFSKAVDNIEQGKTSFLNSADEKSTTSAAASSGAVGASGGTYSPQSVGYSSPVQDSGSVQQLEQTDYVDETQTDGDMMTSDVNLDAGTIEEIDSQLEVIAQNKEACNSVIALVDEQAPDIQADYEETNSMIAELNQEISQNDENISTSSQAMEELQTQYDEGQKALDDLTVQQQGVSEELTSVNSQIASLEVVQCPAAIPNDATEEERIQHQTEMSKYMMYKNNLRNLEEQRAQIEQQLADLTEQVQEQESANEEIAMNLADATANYAAAVSTSEVLDEEQKAYVVELAQLSGNLALYGTAKQNAQSELALAESHEAMLEERKKQLQTDEENKPQQGISYTSEPSSKSSPLDEKDGKDEDD